uniref:Uncharacterized protein n=1 Tax=Opuntia streptacantha TaxID=393608 RepID=A0A7C9APL1_OPUST
MLQIKEDDKFFTRLLSKESNNSNMGCSSFRVYYGGVSDSVAVPFVWEAKPGTPKHSFSHSDHHHLHLHDELGREIPPLTPPPPISPVIHRKKKKKPTSNKKVKFLVRLFISIMRRVRCRRQIS